MTQDFVTVVSVVIAFVLTAVVRFLLLPKLAWFRPDDEMRFLPALVALVIVLVCFVGTQRLMVWLLTGLF